MVRRAEKWSDSGYILGIQRKVANRLDIESQGWGQWGYCVCVCVCVSIKYTLFQGQDLASIFCLNTFSGSHGPQNSPDVLLRPSSPSWSGPCWLGQSHFRPLPSVSILWLSRAALPSLPPACRGLALLLALGGGRPLSLRRAPPPLLTHHPRPPQLQVEAVTVGSMNSDPRSCVT